MQAVQKLQPVFCCLHFKLKVYLTYCVNSINSMLFTDLTELIKLIQITKKRATNGNKTATKKKA